MLATVSMCIQFRSYLRGARFIIRTDHKSLVWLHRFKDTEGMMARWLHTLQQFQFTIVHRAGRDHSNADGLSRVPTSPCGQCTRVDCPRGWHDWMMICPDRPPRLEKLSISALYNLRTPPVSRCWSGSGLLVSPPGRK